jgi:LPXTG-motif cell wall-anchored protein
VIRLACLFGLVAIVMAVVLAAHPTGQTAIGFTFVGIPALVAGVGVYGVQRWRAGAFRPNR